MDRHFLLHSNCRSARAGNCRYLRRRRKIAHSPSTWMGLGAELAPRQIQEAQPDDMLARILESL